MRRKPANDVNLVTTSPFKNFLYVDFTINDLPCFRLIENCTANTEFVQITCNLSSSSNWL